MRFSTCGVSPAPVRDPGTAGQGEHADRDDWRNPALVFPLYRRSSIR
jgi:hypothetical protein